MGMNDLSALKGPRDSTRAAAAASVSSFGEDPVLMFDHHPLLGLDVRDRPADPLLGANVQFPQRPKEIGKVRDFDTH
jgi:hypothetical protein